MSTYTSSLGLEEITPGDQAGLWGNTTNNNLALIDQAVTGVTPISFAALSGSTYTLTDYSGAVDEARSAVLNITGNAAGANTVVVPNKQKTYLVRNNTGQDVVFQTASPSATFTVEAGNSILVFCDGNNNVFTGIASPSVGTLGVSGGGTGQTTFGGGGFVKSSGGTNALTATSSVSLITEVTGTLPTANGGTGQTTFSSGGLLRGNGGGPVATLVGSGVGHVATWNGSEWVSQAPATGGVASVFGRTGAVTAQSGDYSSFYPTLSGTNSFSGSNTFANISSGGVTLGSATPAGSGINSGAYNFTAGTSIYRNNGGSGEIVISNGGAAQFVFATNANFTASGGNVICTSAGGYSALQQNAIALGNANTGMSSDGSTSFGWVIQSVGVATLTSAGNLSIAGSTAIKASGSTWINPSDIRLKQNITNYTNGLSKLMQVQPKTWEFNGKGDTKNGTKGLGVIADEIEKVLPNTVSTYKAKLNKDDKDETDIKQFDATEITWLLVNSVKELKAELDAAKAEIAALKAK